MKLLIGVPTAEMARRAIFYSYFHMLEKPPDSFVSFINGQSPARGRNILIQQALDHDCTHILFLDDDVAFAPDLLNKLAAHDKDIVTGLYLMRNYPHQPIIFDVAYDDGRCGFHFLQPNESGLIPIVATGLGACLIKTDVFRKLEQPWIRLGQLEKDHWCDDIDFFLRIKELGIQAYCDLTCLVGHMASLTVWPTYKDGQWFTSYDTSGTGQVTFPAVRLHVADGQTS